jgi:hypothetical protein
MEGEGVTSGGMAGVLEVICGILPHERPSEFHNQDTGACQLLSMWIDPTLLKVDGWEYSETKTRREHGHLIGYFYFFGVWKLG